MKKYFCARALKIEKGERDVCELAVNKTARRYNLESEYWCMNKSARMSLKTKWGLDGAQARNAHPIWGLVLNSHAFQTGCRVNYIT